MRTRRKLSAVDLYHVIARGTGRQIIFDDDADRRTFLRLMGSALDASEAELYAWCLMSNHVHLLLHAPIEDVAATMKRLCGTYARYYNDKTGRVGHLFQERYKSEPISDDAYLMTVVRYIHENPSRAGLATSHSYPWSSYGEYVGEPTICKTSFVVDVFGGVDEFIRFHTNGVTNDACMDVDAPRSRTRPMPDDAAKAAANQLLGDNQISRLKELPAIERDARLRELKAIGLSIRQIERLSGVGRNTVARA